MQGKGGVQVVGGPVDPPVSWAAVAAPVHRSRLLTALVIGVVAEAAILLIADPGRYSWAALVCAVGMVAASLSGGWVSDSLARWRPVRIATLMTATAAATVAALLTALSLDSDRRRDETLATIAVVAAALVLVRSDRWPLWQAYLGARIWRLGLFALAIGAAASLSDRDVSVAGALLLVALPILVTHLSFAENIVVAVLRAIPVAAVVIVLLTDGSGVTGLATLAAIATVLDLCTGRAPAVAADSVAAHHWLWWLIGAGLLTMAALATENDHLALYFGLSAVALLAVGGVSLVATQIRQRMRMDAIQSDLVRWRSVADFDDLTGLPLRGALSRRLSEEVERSIRYRQPMCVCFIDIDHFKRVNDEFGHATGDQVLAGVASLIRSTVRTPDFVARYGGEEFVVIAPATWSEDAVILGSRIQQALREQTFANVNRAITVSIGIAGVPEHGANADLILNEADRALYAAKFAGRDRIEIASNPDSEPA